MIGIILLRWSILFCDSRRVESRCHIALRLLSELDAYVISVQNVMFLKFQMLLEWSCVPLPTRACKIPLLRGRGLCDRSKTPPNSRVLSQRSYVNILSYPPYYSSLDHRYSSTSQLSLLAPFSFLPLGRMLLPFPLSFFCRPLLTLLVLGAAARAWTIALSFLCPCLLPLFGSLSFLVLLHAQLFFDFLNCWRHEGCLSGELGFNSCNRCTAGECWQRKTLCVQWRLQNRCRVLVLFVSTIKSGVRV